MHEIGADRIAPRRALKERMSVLKGHAILAIKKHQAVGVVHPVLWSRKVVLGPPLFGVTGGISGNALKHLAIADADRIFGILGLSSSQRRQKQDGKECLGVFHSVFPVFLGVDVSDVFHVGRSERT